MGKPLRLAIFSTQLSSLLDDQKDIICYQDESLRLTMYLRQIFDLSNYQNGSPLPALSPDVGHLHLGQGESVLGTDL